jgi:hypothetical protein
VHRWPHPRSRADPVQTYQQGLSCIAGNLGVPGESGEFTPLAMDVQVEANACASWAFCPGHLARGQVEPATDCSMPNSFKGASEPTGTLISLTCCPEHEHARLHRDEAWVDGKLTTPPKSQKP